ncbi:MAG: DUF3800 domain-containing protein [Gilliamella sp.]|uniref:DUF3800 domain-containing protein n=1 Tax=Gilliamella sp. TaxID=1891236 RepID=UPI0026061E1F|nr:DUF3800 domain-containing protein [Gilliamella sp.]MCO6553272.1 DUF3800 domain-containing protein [Gilliamella sp.]MCO6560263.1 DUF3800 domain-containing protein [Gilliamella sp.]
MQDTYIVYLDEFGHIGPYISADHPKHKTHPVFGLGGFVIPICEARSFSSFFFNLKQNLFSNYDIPKARKDIEKDGGNFQLSMWEKKGSKQYSVTNLKNYKNEITRSTNRIINKITDKGGFLFFVGEAKNKKIERHNSLTVYTSCLSEIIKRLDDEFKNKNAYFLIFMDDNEDSANLVKKAIYDMHQKKKYQLIEAPVQVDSKLYQTIQCADWLCSIYGKIAFYDIEPESKPDYILFKKYFGDRIASAQKRSNVRNNLPKLADEHSLRKLAEHYNKKI